MKLLTICLLILAGSFASSAQEEFAVLPDSGSNSHDSIDSTAASASSTPAKGRLMPANISFVERGLWGEDGLVRSTGLLPPLSPSERRYELRIRRTMLTGHLVGGIVTFGLMATAVYFGQRTIDNLHSRSLRNNHQTFVALTIASYSATGLLAVLAPPPLIRRDETSTITIHKTLAWIHVAGMILTPLLASGRHMSVNSQLRVHQVSAYVTTATFAASMIVITL